MPWARLDDSFFINPKIRKAWRCRPALGLHTMALSHAMHFPELEGSVPQEFVEDQLPDPGEREQVVAALVDCGLWRERPEGWLIHDFLKYNPSAADIKARRKADRERKQGFR